MEPLLGDVEDRRMTFRSIPTDVYAVEMPESEEGVSLREEPKSESVESVMGRERGNERN